MYLGQNLFIDHLSSATDLINYKKEKIQSQESCNAILCQGHQPMQILKVKNCHI